MTKLMSDAENGGYAVSYCEAWNLESLQAVIQAAESLNSPIIAGFNGGFLMHPERAAPEKLEFYAGMGQGLREAAVPVSFLLNETDSLSQIEEGVRLGFNAVMVENEHLDLEEYRRLVKQVVRIAHDNGASVEAQLGKLPAASGHSPGEPTDPETARAFVNETGIDALGVAVGNVHCLTDGKAPIDLEALESIRRHVGIPLVLHGGSGIPLETLQSCIRLGVAKVNFGTVLKQAYLAAVRERLAAYREPMDPHGFLGVGGPPDILTAGREAVKAKVQEILRFCGSTDKVKV